MDAQHSLIANSECPLPRIQDNRASLAFSVWEKSGTDLISSLAASVLGTVSIYTLLFSGKCVISFHSLVCAGG